ncbi:hypothetical protein MAM1_0005c00604 [Mucor ambiguus]|uniref:Uncharacterized protein n=1 Tax=Mucor ambiguus TaxID=91626 RepID=A0A0C9MGU0_9FUNG|nr:hypothetical protein MAM1_0005c00604 [Mucor ambiguus]
MKSARRAIKDTSDNKRRWRDKFKEQCNDRIKMARQQQISKLRENQWMTKVLEQEWSQFKKENEEAMRKEGIDDVDSLIEQSMLDDEAEVYMQQEKEGLDLALEELYQAVACVNCQKAALTSCQIKNVPVLACPQCGFYATEMCLNTILNASQHHSTYCHGLISYSLEPGTDDTIISACNICDLWDMFNLKSLDPIRERPPGNPYSYKSSSPSLETLLQRKDPSNENMLLESINSMIDSLKFTKDASFLEASAYSLMHDLLPLINSENEDVQASAYVCLQYLCEYADHDEVAYNMMNELICVDYNHDNPLVSLQNARFSVVLLEMFGKSLEKMTRARDWMLYLTLLANFFVTRIEAMTRNLIQDSSLGSSSPPSDWDSCCTLYSNSCLDLIHFIHSKTVAKDPSTFPFNSTDIGKEDGDTKRRYLAYFLTSLILEKVIANLDLQLSDTYFKMLNPVYASRIKIHRSGTNAPVKSMDRAYEPMYDIVHRTMELSLKYGLSFHSMHQLQMSLYTHTDSNYSEEQRSRELDLQVINNKAYPLSFDGVAVLLCLSLYDKLIYPTITSKSSMGLYDDTMVPYNLTKQYFGIVMNLCLKCQDQICMADKGIFVLLFMSQGIDHVKVSMDMLDKWIPGPCADQPAITASSVIQLLTTVASTCPDSTIRFVTYKLIEKFISLGDEQVQLFLFEELLQRCPYPSMNVAAIGLFKDSVCKVFEEKKFTSAFASPIILTEFVPIILKYKYTWETKHSEFWNDYNYTMQALVFYRTVCINDKQKLTALWDTTYTMNEIYFEPLSKLLDELNTQYPEKEMQIETMKYQIGLIYSDILDLKPYENLL